VNNDVAALADFAGGVRIHTDAWHTVMNGSAKIRSKPRRLWRFATQPIDAIANPQYLTPDILLLPTLCQADE
jgi:hypothetical protein